MPESLVITGKQLCNLARVINSNQKFDLSVPKKKENRKLPSYSTESAAPKKEADSDCVVLVRIVSGNSTEGYDVNLYENGLSEEPTGSGLLFLSEIAAGATLPSGSWVLAYRSKTLITKGTEE